MQSINDVSRSDIVGCLEGKGAIITGGMGGDSRKSLKKGAKVLLVDLFQESL